MNLQQILEGAFALMMLIGLGALLGKMRFRALVFLVMLTGTLQAQTLDVTTLHGRVYNITTGTWSIASVPGVEFCVANVTVSGSWWFDVKAGFFEQDYAATWTILEAKEQPKTWRDRLTVSVTGAFYIFRELGTDRVWLVETRYRVFGRN